MHSMFFEAESFNQDLTGWNVENCTTMVNMFLKAKKCEGKGLEGWNVEKCKEMCAMFKNCKNFNHDSIKNWDLNGKEMKSMLNGGW